MPDGVHRCQCYALHGKLALILLQYLPVILRLAGVIYAQPPSASKALKRPTQLPFLSSNEVSQNLKILVLAFLLPYCYVPIAMKVQLLNPSAFSQMKKKRWKNLSFYKKTFY